jgi:MoaA/NifB/PqqE/SkfB family radical SAM enzyme
MRLIEFCPSPAFVVWDITYACPLRCCHCYSESGRRPSRQLNGDQLLQVTDALTEAKPKGIVLSGGEPLAVKEIFQVARKISGAGVNAILYTSGWNFAVEMLPEITSLFSRVTVSLDGATPEMHDRIRGRAGSFDRALNALSQLNDAVSGLRSQAKHNPLLGIDFVVMRSNFHQLSQFCTEVLPLFPQLSAVSFAAVIPTGLGSRASFAEQELLDPSQVVQLLSIQEELQSLAPSAVTVSTSDNRKFQMHPDLLSEGMDIPPLQVEPDGSVRAMPIYEGTIGSLLEEPLTVLWERAMERWSDPFVIRVLRPAHDFQEWAEATRQIDLRFGTSADLDRIRRRPLYNGSAKHT